MVVLSTALARQAAAQASASCLPGDTPAQNAAKIAAYVTAANIAGSTNAIIYLDPRCAYEFDSAAPGISSALPEIEANITIEGQGATISRKNPGTRFRFAQVLSGHSLTLRQLTLKLFAPPNGNNGENSSTLDDAENGTPGHDGGALHNQGTLLLENVVISECAAGDGGGGGTGDDDYDGGHGAPGGRGGAIFNVGAGSKLTVRDSRLALNRAGKGGWGGNAGGDTQGGNGANGGNGGAVWIESGEALIERTTVHGNSAGDGGPAGAGRVNGSVGQGGRGGDGGGIDNQGSITILDSTIERNQAGQGGQSFAETRTGGSEAPAGDAGNGGGLSVGAGTLTIRRSTFGYNTGGAANVGAWGDGSTRYSSPGHGGAIFIRGLPGTALIENSSIAGNDASPTECVYRGSTSTQDHLPGGEGGGIYLLDGRLDLKNVTFAANRPGQVGNCSGPAVSAGTGASLFNAGGSVHLWNSILSTPSWTPFIGQPVTSTDNCGGTGAYVNETPSHNLAWNELAGAITGGCPSGFLLSDPKLGPLDAATPFSLGRDPALGPTLIKPLAGSAAVDKGASCLLEDQRKKPRPSGTNCDIGSYEVQFTLLSSPTSLTVDDGTSVTFTAQADTEGFEAPLVQWQSSSNGGQSWGAFFSKVAATKVGNVYESKLQFVARGANAGQYRAVFESLVGGGPSGAATLTVNFFMKIDQDLPSTVTANAGSPFQLPYSYSAYPAPANVIWERRTGSTAAWVELYRVPGFTPGAGSNHTEGATLQMEGYQYRFRLTPGAGSGLSEVVSNIATLHVTNITGAPAFAENYPADVFATEGDVNDQANFAAFLTANNPLPTLGWQGVNNDGVLADLSNGDPTDFDAYHFNTTPGTSSLASLVFRAWGDQDLKLFRAKATNSFGTATSRLARLYVQVPTQISLDCPSPVLRGATYQCTVTVAANPARGPRPRKPCGEVLVRTQLQERTCYLNGQGQCTVSFTAPGQGWTSMQHQLIYFGGGNGQPCNGLLAPPDQQSQGSHDVDVADCVKPSFTSCPAAQTVDAAEGSCDGLVPDLLEGLELGETGCQVSLSQSPAAGSSLPVGTHTVTITAETTAGSASCPVSVTVRDSSIPTLQVPETPLETSCKQPIPLIQGVTASDACDTTASVLIVQATVDFTTPGTYTVTYKARDKWGNESAPVERDVIVRDTQGPQIQLLGENPMTLSCGASYVEPGAEAVDACAGPVDAIPSGSVDVQKSGTYTITYTAIDPSGNRATATRTVNVQSGVPVITLQGPASLDLECPSAYTEPGATWADGCGGSGQANVSGSVDTGSPGSYTITYSYPNAQPVYRTVNVRDTQRPLVTLNGADAVAVECHTSYTELGATAADGCAGNLAAPPSGSVDVNTLGSYTITYSATDPSGNTGTATRTVEVVDTSRPTLTLNDPSPITLEGHRATYVERGATATDSCAGSFAAAPSGSVNVNVPGTYTITYNAADPSGNAAVAITRTITVVDTTAPAIASCPGNQVLTLAPGSCSATATYAATASDACGGSTPVVFDPPSGSTFQPGATTVTATATDAYGNKSTCSFTVTVVATPTSTSLALSYPTRQYSDGETLTATVTNTLTIAPVPGGTVTFKIGGSTVGTSAVNASGIATLTLNLVESALLARADLAPGDRTVTATYNGGVACYAASSGTSTLKITREDARVSYTGSVFGSTSCATCGDAVVTLSATVWDITATSDANGDSAAGDIRNATVTFLKVDGITESVIATVPVGLVSASDLKVGAATYNWNVDIGASDSEPYTIGVRVNGYYTRSSSSDYSVVTVSKPIGSNFISGGGYLVLSSSAGLKPGDKGSKNNFGFNVKYNKSGKSLQGRINTLVRQLESDGVVHVYQIKGNAMTSLTADVKTGKAVFNGKANITDVTDPLAPVTVDGNGTLTVTMTDKGEPGSADSIGIALFNKDGGLWFSSSFEAGKTVEKVLNGGNLVVK